MSTASATKNLEELEGKLYARDMARSGMPLINPFRIGSHRYNGFEVIKDLHCPRNMTACVHLNGRVVA